MSGSTSNRARWQDLKAMSAASTMTPVPPLSVSSLGHSAAAAAAPVPAAQPSSARRSARSRSSSSFRSTTMCWEIQLAEAVERARTADRMLRGKQGEQEDEKSGEQTSARSSSEQLVDRSLSQLAQVVTDILQHTLADRLSPPFYKQISTVLDQLVWSPHTRLVTLSATDAVATAAPSSSSSLPSDLGVHLHRERLTHYELNLLHARNDENWRQTYQQLSERHQSLQAQVGALQAANADLTSQLDTAASESEASSDRQRELERSIQSLEGRLRLSHQQYDEMAGDLATLKQLVTHQEELLVQSKQERLQRDKQMEHNRSHANNEEGRGGGGVQEDVEELKEALSTAEQKVKLADEQVSTLHKLYYALQQSTYQTIAKKDALQAGLNETKEELNNIKANHEDLLRPYTPRPDWNNLYREHICELTPTLLSESPTSSTAQQAERLLKHLSSQETELEAQQQVVQQMMEVQIETKREWAKSKRDLELAVRANLSGAAHSASSLSSLPASPSPLLLPLHTSPLHIHCLGVHPEVRPAFLRWVGVVRHRHWSHTDTRKCVKEVWERKKERDREKGYIATSLAEFVLKYLHQQCGGTPALVAECGYNLVDSLSRYSWDPKLSLFRKVLFGEVCEEAFYDQGRLLHTLIHLFIALDIKRSERKPDKATGNKQAAEKGAGGAAEEEAEEAAPPVATLPLSYFSQALRLLFPHKSDSSFSTLMTALSTVLSEHPSTRTDYSLLFQSDPSLPESAFVSEVRSQHLQEIEELNVQLAKAILMLPRGQTTEQAEGDRAEDTPAEGQVLLSQVHAAWAELDPRMSVEAMDRHISLALSLSLPLSPSLSVSPAPLARTICTSFIKPTLNFDADACAWLHTLHLPEEKPATPRMGKKDKKKQAAEWAAGQAKAKRGSAISFEEIKAAFGGGGEKEKDKNHLGPSHASGSSKPENLFSSPQFHRLRARFGLPPTSDDVAPLERGPAFVHPAVAAAQREDTAKLSKAALHVRAASALPLEEEKQSAPGPVYRSSFFQPPATHAAQAVYEPPPSPPAAAASATLPPKPKPKPPKSERGEASARTHRRKTKAKSGTSIKEA